MNHITPPEKHANPTHTAYKALALDLDGTILDSEGQLDEKVIRDIKRIEESGVTVVLATGRMLPAVIPFWEKLELKTPIICYNGARIIRPGENALRDRALDPESAHAISEYCKSMNIHIQVYAEDRLWVYAINDRVKWYSKHFGIPANIIDPQQPWPLKKPTKILAVTDENLLETLHAQLSEQFSDRTNITTSSRIFVEMLPPGTDKGDAIEFLAGELGIPLPQWVAVGDSRNDLEMLKKAGLGVAIRSGEKELRAHANAIVEHPLNNGLEVLARQAFKLS